MRVTIFSTGGEIPPCFDFCVVTRSYSSPPFLCALDLLYRLDAGTFATMGLGCGFAIAAALLNKTKPVKQQSPVVCIQGDSAFGFSGMEVETACRLAELCDLHVCHILCIMRF